MSRSNALQALLLAGILGLNVQIFVLSERVVQPVVAPAELPKDIASQLTDLDRLRAENAALQVIVKHATFSHVIEGGPAPASQPVSTPPLDWTYLPPFPDPDKSQTSSQLGNSVGGETSAAQPAKKDSMSAAKASADTGNKKPAVIFHPIRMREDGALLYLASDGNIRVVREGGQLYGINGRFIEGDGRQAIFEMAGRRFPLPLVGE